MTQALSVINVAIDKSEVCRYLGYINGQRPTASISSLIDGQIEEAYRLIEPSYSYAIKKVRGVEGPNIFIEGFVKFRSNIVGRILSKCHEAAIFLATIGSGIDERVAQLMKEGEVLKAVVLDAVGSEAVEKVTCWLERSVKEMAAASDAEASLRYSPGYCDWDIKQQKVLFAALDGDLAGVELTEDCLMIPRKSVSGIIGIGFDRAITASPCLSCPKKDCPNRRTSFEED
jgi:hypothetical protein